MIYFAIILFILGAIVGSFLNVVIARLGTGMKISRGRSKCFSCGHTLVWYDLFPFFSFMFLRGRCRYCGSSISRRYFVVELVTAVLFSLGAAFGIPKAAPDFVFLFLSLVIISFFVAIAFYDIRHKIIPDSLSYGVAAIALAFSVFSIFEGSSSWWRLLDGFIIAAPFAFFWLVSRGQWMGLGDAKLALSIGWWLGIFGAGGAIILSIFSGAAVGIVILIAEKMRLGKVKWGKHEIPFGPFLIIGALAAHFLGITIWTFLGYN